MLVRRLLQLLDLLQLPDESAESLENDRVKHQSLHADRGRPNEEKQQLVKDERQEVDETLGIGRFQSLDGIAHLLLDTVLFDVTRKPRSFGATGEEEEMVQTLVLY